MARSFFFLSLTLSLLLSAAAQQEASQPTRRLRQAQQCRLERLSASRPSRRIQQEGGVTELWNENDDEFQCAGVAAMRNIIQPNALSLPNFSPAPRLVYIERGRGLLGVSYPGCAETYHSSTQPSGEQAQRPGRSFRDQHQKVHRIDQGEIVALPAGAVHWCYNDGNEQLVAVSITDVNNQANLLDPRPRSFYLAGGKPRELATEEINAENIIRSFDPNLLAEAFGVSEDTVRKMQQEDRRGFIVRVEGGEMRMIRPEEELEEGEYEERRRRGGRYNGLEETLCNMKINQYFNPREADVYSRQAGRINSINMHKLHILSYLELSAEKTNLYPGAIYVPHWSMNSHTIIYITRGSGRIQVVGSNGNRVLDEEVSPGEMVVVPQYFASTKRAGPEGMEWVGFKTSALPMKSPVAGSRSALRGMPVQVLANAYRFSPREAEDVKYNRENNVYLVPGTTTGGGHSS